MNMTLVDTPTLTYITLPEPGRISNDPPWGWHLALNLYDCNLGLISSAEVIRDYVIELCDLIEMRRFGEPMIVNFGEDPRVTGYSLVQLIETSNICAHFADQSGAAYIDIFSCKKFDPEIAASFSIATFQAQKHTGAFISRE